MENLHETFVHVALSLRAMILQMDMRILWAALVFIVPLGGYLFAATLFQAHKHRKVLRENRAGLQLQRWKMWEQAIACFRNAVDIDPDSAVSHYNLGYALYYGKGLWVEALNQFNKALALDTSMPEAFYSRGHIKFHCQNEHQSAERDLHIALRLDPGMAEPHNTLGLIRIAMQDWEGAIREFHNALRVNPKYEAAHSNLGIALINLGRNSEGILALERCSKLDSSNAVFWKNLGNAYGASHLLAEALSAFRKAARIDPNCWSTHFWTGCVQLQMSQLEPAVSEFHRAIALKGPFALANYNLALCYEMLKKYALAKKHMDLAIELDPVIGKDLIEETTRL